MDKIKVVIWDLDETFWGGTLSEGAIRYCAPHHDLVIALARRGIISSVCSKNDPEPVRELLERHGIAEYFVFVDVGWQPKGERIARLLERMKLRAANALFIDDNPMNLEEARFYSPGLQTAAPEMLAGLLADPRAEGKTDPELSRLAHYRILEQKLLDRSEQRSSNEEFLRQSGIVVTRSQDVAAQLDRVLERIERTHQLNFTKQRWNREQILELVADGGVDAGLLRVRDRYGDYGICAFYALRAGKLIHFLFSCRILDMGVEQWLFAQLGHPAIEIREPVAASLPTPADPAVDWIREAPAAPSGSHPLPQPPDPARGPRVLLKGGCDLEQLRDFLGVRRFDSELNYVTAAGVSVHREHTEILRAALRPLPVDAALSERIPFLDERAFQTRMFAGGHDAVIYSALMDFTQGLYRQRDSGRVVPYGDFLQDITDPHLWPALLRDETRGFSVEFLEWFAAEFTFLGGISGERFAANLHWLADQIGGSTLLILLNGAEVVVPHALERQRHEHHRAMNAIIDGVVAERPRVALCDVRSLVATRADVTDNIRHYRRRIYGEIAGAMRAILATRLDMRFGAVGCTVRDARVRVEDTVKRGLRRILAPFTRR